MDLLNLAAKITLDDSSYKKGIQNAESLGNQLRGKMSAWTVAMGNLAADMVKKGIDAVGKVVGGAIDGYADYQQLIGGVETLFKSSANKVAAYAKQSYKTTGLSANDYMETVTSFSASLLQGLGGDTEAAAELANTAITDMADNANKMGTDISMIQSAYQGFAKQNYTMLDNLKLGYGGTQSEMVRLINDSKILDHEIKNLDGITFDQMISAIHKVQTEMGITGTTAKEAAETISGSKASLKASWEDLLTAVGGGMTGPELDERMGAFKESFTAYMENFIPTLVQTIAGSGNLVTAIADAIGSLPKDLLSQVAEAGLEGGTEMVGGISKITGWIIDSITNMFKSAGTDAKQVEDFGKAIGEFLGNTIEKIVVNAPDLLAGIVKVGVSLAGSLIEGLWTGLFGDEKQVDKLTDKLGEDLGEINMKTTKADAILDYMDGLVDKYGKAAYRTDEWKAAQQELSDVLEGSDRTFMIYGENIEGAIKKLRKMNDELREATVMDALQRAVSDEMTLLTSQTLEYNKAQYRLESRQSQQASYRQNVVDAIRAAAAERAAEYWASSHDQAGNLTNGFFSESYYQDLQNYAQGLYDFGDGLKSLSDLDFTQLESIANDFDGVAEILETNKKLYDQAQLDIDAANSELESGQKEIEATRAAIEETKAAMDKTAKDILGSGTDAAQKVATSGDSVAEALNAAAGAIAAIDFSGPGGGNEPEAAIGINDVPWDGFKAKLHKGEAVLSRSEAEKWRNGGGNGSADVVSAIQSMRNDLQNMKLVVGQRTFGRTVVDYGGNRVSSYIGEAENRAASGYGA